MLLTGWIKEFVEQMERVFAPIDSLFAEFDSEQEGSLSFNDFAKMNDSLSISTSRKDLHRIFDAIDRQKNGKIRLEDLKNLSQFTMSQDNSLEPQQPDWYIEESGLKGD